MQSYLNSTNRPNKSFSKSSSSTEKWSGTKFFSQRSSQNCYIFYWISAKTFGLTVSFKLKSIKQSYNFNLSYVHGLLNTLEYPKSSMYKRTMNSHFSILIIFLQNKKNPIVAFCTNFQNIQLLCWIEKKRKS